MHIEHESFFSGIDREKLDPVVQSLGEIGLPFQVLAKKSFIILKQIDQLIFIDESDKTLSVGNDVSFIVWTGREKEVVAEEFSFLEIVVDYLFPVIEIGDDRHFALTYDADVSALVVLVE